MGTSRTNNTSDFCERFEFKNPSLEWNFSRLQAFDILQGQKKPILLTDITSYENLHKPFNRFEHWVSRAKTQVLYLPSFVVEFHKDLKLLSI